MPNKPAAPNAAIALRFQVERHWRDVGEPGCYVSICGD